MSVNLSPLAGAGAQFFTDSGTPLTGGLLYTYSAGTTTPRTTYTDNIGATANSNPIVLDAAGRVPYEIWLLFGLNYKFVLKTSVGVTIGTWDNISGVNGSPTATSFYADAFTATAGQVLFTLSANPGSINNLDVSLDGSTLVAGDDFSWSGISITLNTPAFVNQRLRVAYSTVDGVQAISPGSVIDNSVAVGTDLYNRIHDTVSVKDFGAVGDGVTDDGAAFASACAYLYGVGGGTLDIPFGKYKNARVEVHGHMQVRGNGSTVQYVGIGQTIIAGTGSGTSAVPTAWPTDSGYLPSIPATTMYTLSIAPAVGDMTLTLSSASGIVAGMYLFVAGNPSSASSPTNYIPQDFEFVCVKSVLGAVVTLSEPLLSSYLTTQSGVFYTPGLAVNCSVSDLTISPTADAYQYVIRSSYGCTMRNIIFAGEAAVGASTFSAGLRYENILVAGSYSAISTARGTVSTTIDGFQWNRRNGSTSDATALFIEESFYRIDVNNFVANGGAFSIRATDMSAGQRPRLLTVSGSSFDASTAYGGSTSPLSIGSCLGADLLFRDSVFKGTAVVPLSSSYPGITGTALVWQSSNLSTDNTQFFGCKFISSNANPTWPLAAGGAFGGISGFLGNIEFDSKCVFSTCNNAYLRPWVATLIGSTAAPTTPVQVTGYYTKEGKRISAWCDFQSVNTTGATGNIQISGLPFQSGAGNFIGLCMTANLGAVATTTLVSSADTKIQVMNNTTWATVPIVAAAGKYLTCSISYTAS